MIVREALPISTEDYRRAANSLLRSLPIHGSFASL
jgi:hypothetical protein